MSAKLLMMIVSYEYLYFAGSIDSDLPSSPQSSETGREDSPLNLINALAACVLSAKLSPLYKQWAVKEFIQVWLKINRVYFDITCMLEPYWCLAKQWNFDFFYSNFFLHVSVQQDLENCACSIYLITWSTFNWWYI